MITALWIIYAFGWLGAIRAALGTGNDKHWSTIVAAGIMSLIWLAFIVAKYLEE